MNFKEKVTEAQKELSTKAYVEYSAVARLVKAYGLENVLKAVKYLPLQHPNPIGYITMFCRGGGKGTQINVNIFNKDIS